MKVAVFWHVTPLGSIKNYQCFIGDNVYSAANTPICSKAFLVILL